MKRFGKCFAGRHRDLSDAEQIIARNPRKIDVAYIRYWLKQLAQAAAQAAKAVEQALGADPQLRQLSEQSERWRNREYELRKMAAAPAK